MTAKVKLEKEIKSFIKMSGGFAWRNETTGIYDVASGNYRKKESSDRGSSDLLAVFNGFLICIETKIGTDKQSDSQKEFQEGIKGAGGVYMIVNDYEGFLYQWDLFIWWIEQKRMK